MGKPLTKIEDIINELIKLQTIPVPYRDEGGGFSLPRIIDAGNGGSLTVNRRIDDTIAKVADELMKDASELKMSFTIKEWRASVRRAFGPELAAIDLKDDLTKNAEKVFTGIRLILDRQSSGYGKRELAFGCSLFSNENIRPFVIGHVRFEPRTDWLDRKCKDGGISKVVYRRIKKKWKGEHIRRRKSTPDYLCEKYVLDAVGGCAFVCSVSTNGLAPEAGREKALTVARCATASIALLWSNSSENLNGMNLLFDRRINQQITLSFIPGKVVQIGWQLSHPPHGPWMKGGEWEKEIGEHADYFRVVGEVLDYVISPTGSVLRPKLMNTLAQALLWFHEGCRETVTLVAIVKFSAALDALATGRKASGIRRLINARVGFLDNDPIYDGGPSLKQAIDQIYSDGRSRTIHGTNDKLGYDWIETGDLAEQFARICLLSCLDWAGKNASCDEPKQMSE